MNILKLFYITFSGKLKDYYLLQQFYSMLTSKRVSIKIKNFHAYDDFYKTIVQAHIITLYMHYQNFTKITNLQTWFLEMIGLI